MKENKTALLNLCEAANLQNRQGHFFINQLGRLFRQEMKPGGKHQINVKMYDKKMFPFCCTN
jgi:hypothetical protein